MKNLPQEFFVGLQEEENYLIIKIIIYKYIHKYNKKSFMNFSLDCFIKDVN